MDWPMKIIYLVKRYHHHTASGGYDRLAQAMGGTVVGRTGRGGLGNRVVRRLWRKWSRPRHYLLDYKDEDWLAECKLLVRANIKRPDIVHILYGDDQLDTLLRWRRLLPCPLVATFHLPANRDSVKARFEQHHKHILGGIDAAIVVARNQLPDFQRWLGPERVVYIPHGIDTQRFCPEKGELNRDVIRLVSVGEHMRDLEALHRIMDECRNLKLPVEFNVVISEKCYPFFSGCSNVRFHTDITENQLINLYRKADALLLPILDATANNAVLESMACGTPVISTAIGGIPDYVDETAGWLFPKGEVDGIVGLIKAGCDNREVFLSRRAGARAKSFEFDWQQIKKQMLLLYEAVRNGLPIDLKSNTTLGGGFTKQGQGQRAEIKR
jgi:glycosyltransferase involved in cell wall biosynthesis